MGWGSARVLGLLAAAAALFAAWAAIERRVPEPLVDLRTFARREMAATNLTTLVVGFSMFSTFILLPNFVQIPEGPGTASAPRRCRSACSSSPRPWR